MDQREQLKETSRENLEVGDGGAMRVRVMRKDGARMEATRSNTGRWAPQARATTRPHRKETTIDGLESRSFFLQLRLDGDLHGEPYGTRNALGLPRCRPNEAIPSLQPRKQLQVTIPTFKKHAVF